MLITCIDTTSCDRTGGRRRGPPIVVSFRSHLLTRAPPFSRHAHRERAGVGRRPGIMYSNVRTRASTLAYVDGPACTMRRQDRHQTLPGSISCCRASATYTSPIATIMDTGSTWNRRRIGALPAEPGQTVVRHGHHELRQQRDHLHRHLLRHPSQNLRQGRHDPRRDLDGQSALCRRPSRRRISPTWGWASTARTRAGNRRDRSKPIRSSTSPG